MLYCKIILKVQCSASSVLRNSHVICWIRLHIKSTSYFAMSDNIKEIIIVAESTFKASPPSCFMNEKEQNGGVHPPSMVAATVVTSDDQIGNYTKFTEVETMEDVEQARRQLCGTPLVFTVTCGKHVPMGQR